MRIPARPLTAVDAFRLLCCAFYFSSGSLHAQGAFTHAGPSAPVTASALSYNFDAEGSYFGRGTAYAGNTFVGDITEFTGSADFVLSASVSEYALLRFGVEWQGYSWDPPATAPIPPSVQGLDAAIGADLQVSPAVLLRIEAHPGVYSQFHTIMGDDVNVPFEVVATYFVSSNLLVVAGVHVDLWANTPVFPVIGVHWKVSDKWVIEGLPPRPQLQYLLSDKITLFAGADLRETTFRVDQDFGQPRGMPKLDNAILDYFEVRGGGGLTWKVSNNINLDLEAGCTPYRRFDYPRVNDGYKVKSEDFAPYFRVALAAKF
jgi:hypothetical protein